MVRKDSNLMFYSDQSLKAYRTIAGPLTLMLVKFPGGFGTPKLIGPKSHRLKYNYDNRGTVNGLYAIRVKFKENFHD